MTPAQRRARLGLLAAVETWPCLLSTPIRVMSDTHRRVALHAEVLPASGGRLRGGRVWVRPLDPDDRAPLYDRAPAMTPTTGIPGEAVMLVAPRTRGGSSAAVVGERDTIREMAARGGRRVLEVATIDGHGCLVPATRGGRGEMR